MHATVSQDQSQSVFKKTSYTQTSHTHPQDSSDMHIYENIAFSLRNTLLLKKQLTVYLAETCKCKCLAVICLYFYNITIILFLSHVSMHFCPFVFLSVQYW